MKVALLGNSQSIHCIRWANGLVARGVEVVMISAHLGTEGFNPAVDLRIISPEAPVGYIVGAIQVRKILSETQPDLVNAHYASGYGLLARLAAYRPMMLSIWGADIYDFPHKSPLHAWLIRSNLDYADAIGSTSKCMALEANLISAKRPVYITPFGVDTKIFYPTLKPLDVQDLFIIGTVKTLSSKYGVDILVEAFAMLWKHLKRPSELRLEIAGGGEDRQMLEKLCDQLGIAEQVCFHGEIPHSSVPSFLNRMDVFVALSRLDSESFGVAVVEAAACGKPVVVSDAQGLAEVTVNGETGFVVPKNNPTAAFKALLGLINNSQLRTRMGRAGQLHIAQNYSWEVSLDNMQDAYHKVSGC